RSGDVAFVAAAVSAAGRSPTRSALHYTSPESPPLHSKDRHPLFALRFQEGASPPSSIHAASRYPLAHTPFPRRARSILPPCLDHPASCIQNPASAFPNETVAYRWSLLRLPIVFRHSESLQFPRRTDQRHFRLYENAAANAETFATRFRRSCMGRRRAAETSGAPTGVQGDAQRDAQAHDPAARFHSATHTLARFSKHFSPRY